MSLEDERAVDSLVASHELPRIPENAVKRAHVLDTIAQIASDEAPVVFVEGESGCGATTLMAQFCLHESEKCFYLFIKPASRFSYSLDYLRLLLAEQFAAYLGRELSTEQAVDIAHYDALLLAVKKKKRNQPVYFVIDGLQQVPDSERAHLKSIFTEVLPLGVQGFRFLVTGRREAFEGVLSGVKSKNYQVQRMSEAESLQILGDIGVTDEQRANILKTCRGLPGRLASVRRIIKDGGDADKLLGASLNEYPDFISIELQILDELCDDQKLLLALLAYSRYPLPRKHLVELTKIEDGKVAAISEKCKFVSLRDDLPYSDFESETYRRYADRKLEDFRGRALNLQIDHLAKNPSSSEAVQFLPAYYQSLNQQQAIVDLLDPDHYSRLLETTSSISSLRARAAVGAKSALELKQAAGIFQFALQRSIFFDVASSRGFQSRVGALVALGRPGRALDFATQAPTTEMRLKMLAEYARRTVESGLKSDEQIVDSIRDLATRVDLSEIPEELESLAENVAFFDTELAISLLDKAAANKSDSDARDGALVKLSLAAASSRSNSAILEKTRGQVSDERHRSLIAFIASYFGDVALPEIKAIVEGLSADRRIYFLRCVLSGPELGSNALEILDYALDQLVSTASYLPKVRDLADFASPITYVVGREAALPDIIRRMEAQLGLVEKSSSSVHLTDLRIKLAIGEARYDLDSAKRRVLDAYFDVGDIDSLEVKVECLALILRALRKIDVAGVIEAQEGLAQVLHEDLLKSITDLLANTASHFEVVRGSLRAMAEYDLDAAVGVAKSLNTVSARDAAYQHISEALVGAKCASDSAPSILRIVNCITAGWRRDRAIATIVRAAMRGMYKNEWSWSLSAAINMIAHPIWKAEAAIDVLKTQSNAEGRVDPKLLSGLDSAVEEISSDVDSAEILFKAATAISKADLVAASALYDRAEAVLSTSTLNSGSATTTVSICLSLLLRASRAIIKFGLFESSYLERFSTLCEVLPDRCMRIAYYADLATKAACENRIDLAREIIQTYCNPIFSGFSSGSPGARESAGYMFAPLYMTRGKIALNILGGSGALERDGTIASACHIIMSKVSEGDCWSGDMENVAISYEDAESVVELLAEISTDGLIADVVRSLVAAACSRPSAKKLTRQQRAALSEKLLAIVQGKLPQPNSVNHDGYLIEVEAYIARLVDYSSDNWAILESRADKIPNLADRVLVKMEVAKCLPGKMSGLARRTLGECRNEIAEIPSIYDRHGRLESFIEAAKIVDPGMSKSAMADVLEFTFQLDSLQAADKSRRRLLDVAEQLDPKMLDDLVNSIDDDPARTEAKLDLQNLAKVQKVRRRIASAKGSADGSDTEEDVLPSAAWKNLGSLVSGRAEPLVPELLNSYVSACGDWDLRSSYPVLSWYLENISRRVMRSEDVESKVVPLWEVLLLSTELAVRVIQKTAANSDREIFMTGAEGDGIIIRRFNGREDAMDHLRSWLRDLPESDPKSLLLCDPFFSADDIDFLRVVLGECPQRRLVIITSRKSLIDIQSSDFENEWSRTVDQEPPDFEIIGISDVGDDRSPIHDRWLLASCCGLRIGTSLSGLGARFSEISPVSEERVAELRFLLDKYVNKERDVEGRRVRYLSYSI